MSELDELDPMRCNTEQTLLCEAQSSTMCWLGLHAMIVPCTERLSLTDELVSSLPFEGKTLTTIKTQCTTRIQWLSGAR